MAKSKNGFIGQLLSPFTSRSTDQRNRTGTAALPYRFFKTYIHVAAPSAAGQSQGTVGRQRTARTSTHQHYHFTTGAITFAPAFAKSGSGGTIANGDTIGYRIIHPRRTTTTTIVTAVAAPKHLCRTIGGKLGQRIHLGSQSEWIGDPRSISIVCMGQPHRWRRPKCAAPTFQIKS